MGRLHQLDYSSGFQKMPLHFTQIHALYFSFIYIFFVFAFLNFELQLRNLLSILQGHLLEIHKQLRVHFSVFSSSINTLFLTSPGKILTFILGLSPPHPWATSLVHSL